MKQAAANHHSFKRMGFLPWVACVLFSLAIAFFVQRQGLLFALDAKIYDVGLASRASHSPDNIVIAGLTDAFVGEHHVSQIPRDKLARLIKALTAAKPSVIAIDVWLDSRVEDGAKRGDEKLRAALLRAKKAGVPIVLAQQNLEENTIKNTGRKGTTAHGTTIPFFADAATAVGGIDLLPDTDKLIRFLPLESERLPSLSYLTAWHSLKDKNGRQRLALLQKSNSEQLRPLDFYGSPDLQDTPSPAVQIHDAQKILNEPYLTPFLASGKIVFIGATFPRSTDWFQSPYNNAGAKRKFYGVELLANATWTYLQGALKNGMRYSHESPAAQNKVLVVTALIAALVAGAALQGLVSGVVTLLFCSGVALALGFVSASGSAQTWPHFWPPSPLLAGALLAWITGAAWRQRVIGRELKQVRDVFGGYVGKEVLDELGGRLPEMGGETRQVAVLFCDIQGFSALAESLQNDPARVLQMLNDHFEPLVAALKTRGAYVDNYVGDLVMAVFGAPVSQGDFSRDVQAAVQSALDFDCIIEESNIERKKRGELPIEVGIGVHCGPAVVGNLGSQQKIHYTAIGDTVNIASRVESETRHYLTRLLVTEEVTVQCPDLDWEFMAETAVKGRTAPVRLYAVKSKPTLS